VNRKSEYLLENVETIENILWDETRAMQAGGYLSTHEKNQS